jgi:rhodanese-related sulfurtransferase
MTTVGDMVRQARERVEGLGKEQLEAELAEGEVVLVDVRDPRERWQLGTIPGSRHVPRGMLEFWADPTSEYHKPFLRPEQRTVLYCAGGQRSALAAEALMRLGYRNVAHLEIGFNGWEKAGGAVERVPVPEEYRRAQPER